MKMPERVAEGSSRKSKLLQSARWMLSVMVFWGCAEENTTAPSIDLIQVAPQTVEIILPFADFVQGVEIVGGFGSTSDVATGIVARDMNGLNAKTLVRFRAYPDSVAVVDESGVITMYSNLIFRGGRVMLFFDTLQGTVDQPVDVELFAIRQPWHPPTATWEIAVDTAGDQTAWVSPGGGAAVSVGTGTFDRGLAEGDSVAFVDLVTVPLDSATVASWADTTDASRGVLVAASTPGTRLTLVRASLRLDISPSANPDTTVEANFGLADLSYIYDPAPQLPADWLRVGGTPSWRSVITFRVPRMIGGSPAICGAVGCQFDVTTADLNLAEFVLTSRLTEAPFEPSDTTQMDIRPVLEPERMPKSPLGDPLGSQATTLPPAIFAERAGSQVALTVTGLIRGILESEGDGDLPLSTIALLNSTEPGRFGFASFEGLGATGAPTLRLVLTLAGQVGLP